MCPIGITWPARPNAAWATVRPTGRCPRDEQEIIERQNIFDGTWEKTPSMGWMFVPLTEYQGGGAAATIEPLKEHLPHYEARLANLFGAGVQACYRGPRLYDSDETKAVVKRWVAFYKQHRPILNSDLIHLRRPDARDWDGWLHVNPGPARARPGRVLQPAASAHHPPHPFAALLHRTDRPCPRDPRRRHHRACHPRARLLRRGLGANPGAGADVDGHPDR